MKPYYQDGSVTIYHADCREVLPTLCADAVVTDPPYGVELAGKSTKFVVAATAHHSGFHGFLRAGVWSDA